MESILGRLDLKTRTLFRLVIQPEGAAGLAADDLQRLASLTGRPVEGILKTVLHIRGDIEGRIQKINDMEESLAVVLDRLRDHALSPGRRLYLERRRDRLTRRISLSRNRIRPPLRQLAELLNEPVQTVASRLRRLRLRLGRV